MSLTAEMENMKNNWDLSNKRATAIVNILENNNSIPKDNLTAVYEVNMLQLLQHNWEGKAKKPSG
jgi:chemotaxis protein MotB